MPKIFSFWKDWDDDDRNRVIKITGTVIALFGIFTLFATVSYLFTWKADQSLLSSAASEASNIAGRIGFKWADLLIRRWFGLASFGFIVVLCAFSVRLLALRWHRSLLRTTVETVTGVVIASLLLAFISKAAGMQNAFGGGLGGECGEAMIEMGCSLFGTVLTGLIAVALAVLWLLFVSKGFNRWVAGLGRKKADAEPAADNVDEQRPEQPKTVKKEAVSPVPPKPVPVEQQPENQNVPEAEDDLSISSEGNLEVVRNEGLSTEVKTELPRINVRDELPGYKFPSLELLKEHSEGRHVVSMDEIARNNERIRAALAEFKIQITDVTAIVGPTVTLYKVYPAPGVKIADIKRLQDDIGMRLNVTGVRVVSLADSVGIEVANDNPSIVPIRAVLNDESFRQSKAELPIAIGYTIQQKVKIFDLTKSPHLLVAGATQQGKSVGLNTMITSLLYAKHPSELKFVFVDPKMVEFSAYASLLHHYLAVLPFNDSKEEEENCIVTRPEYAEKTLRSLCLEMDERYQLISKAHVPNIKMYNEKFKDRHLLPTDGHRFLPYIVTIIDEYADLTMSGSGSGEAKAMSRSIQTSIIRLAQKGRAAGIHVILATQSPRVDVVTGLIKTNFPCRISFKTSSRVDSQTILDSPGAEKLIGRGDMLYYTGIEMERVQCALVDSDEISAVTRFIAGQQGYKKSFNTPYYLPSVEDSSEEGSGGMVDMKNLDSRFEEAARLVVMSQRGSTSDLQRRLGMGYAKAGRVMDQLEAAGVVGPQDGSKPRQVLIGSIDELERVLEAYRNQ